MAADSPAESPDNSSRSSSSESPRNHLRHASVASTNSAAHSENPMTSAGFPSEDWMRPELSSVKEESPFTIEPSYPIHNGFSMDPDLETSNKAMDAAFDFESAASSPSPLKTDNPSHPNPQNFPKSQIWSPSSTSTVPATTEGSAAAASVPQTGSPFFAFGVKEESPFSGQFSNGIGRLAAPHWTGHSPSSLLEESFGGINMNGQSPLNHSMSPNMNFGSPSSFPFPGNFASSPAPHQVDSINSAQPILTVHPTSLKSRVETQIPIRLTLSPLPAGVKKLRLPSHTISKLKFLAPAETEPTPDTLKLFTSLVCTSAMQDREKLARAFARTRGERSQSGANGIEEERPLDGGDVKICTGCIQRERKRASRKKQRKPEEDQLFQKDEEKRVIVFNTSEIKEWTESPKSASDYGEIHPTPPGSMQVELPMRIACYCRHQNEKLGFQVIFTVKDHTDNVVAQAITNSIMITDDHKTQAPSAPPPAGPSPSLPDGTQLPGVGVFSSGHNGKTNGSFASPQSPTDLQGLQQRFNSQYQLTPSSFAAAQLGPSSVTSNSQTPRSLSRQASPTDFPGPQTKRRKHSSSGRLPSELTMTRLETSQPSNSSMSSAAQLAAARGFASPTERPFVTPSSMSGQYGNGPPTPNQSNDNNPFFNPTPAQRQSLDSLAQQPMASAPNSAQPSRPGTPGASGRNNGFQDQNLALTLGANSANQIWPPLAATPNRLPSVIHKLVPAEGSITGGTEVTLLGSGFYPGMEVVFGDTLATTTTFWGDKCLNCLTPPALQPGLVSVVFKHEHPTFGQVQQTQPLMPKQQLFFRYVDDRELQMYRLALNILGQKLGSQADAFQTAQQIMGSDPNAIFNMQKDMQGGSGGGHQRQVPGHESQGKLSDLDSKMLTYLEYIDLDDNPRPPRYNSRSTTGQTLLHFAASLGLTRFVAGLLARGASPDVQDNTGNAPMHLAALHGHAHIVNRLRLAGANANARSIRGFTAADLATTLPAHQAALLPSRHYRSRSVGSLASRRRHSSSASLNSLWEVSSASGSLGHAVDDSEDLDNSEDVDSDDSDANPLFFSSSRRSSMHQDVIPPVVNPGEQPAAPDARGFSPPAAIVAWRNQLAAQINQFQQSVANAFPNIPALPPMPTLPDYQANQMMRRITNLVPHRPTARDGWWDLLKGNTAPSQNQPPSYDELYPHQQGLDEDATEMKKTALLQAATEAALDQHFEAQNSAASASTSAAAAPITESSPLADKDDLKDITIGRKVISREQQKHLREHQARRMKGLGSDRNLYFFWIPLLVLVICAWSRNYVPGIWQGVTDSFDFVKTRYTQRAVDLGI
ncbi:Immunoglobulin E-set [Penicillium macrosclerotiorum]|uniref:Immunoglobulin E-set n=1 Tax=Penicillium macrosclerotiorum TaxID=303699 RepID=UPI002547C05A|nr:Immunoglobulin E-set [Penicillium macrosclerotiorum]KAJ5682305.1 Immunoglobulin E-set [Penicillium macrosclerotiorum]